VDCETFRWTQRDSPFPWRNPSTYWIIIAQRTGK